MMKARPHPTRLDPVVDLVLLSEALFEMVERARRTGDRGTALLASDANEAVLALMDRLEFLTRRVPAQDAG